MKYSFSKLGYSIIYSKRIGQNLHAMKGTFFHSSVVNPKTCWKGVSPLSFPICGEKHFHTTPNRKFNAIFVITGKQVAKLASIITGR